MLFVTGPSTEPHRSHFRKQNSRCWDGDACGDQTEGDGAVWIQVTQTSYDTLGQVSAASVRGGVSVTKRV